MSRRARSIVSVFAGVSLAMSCVPLFAQDDYQEEGTVTGVGPTGLLVTDAKNNRVLVSPNPRAAKITVAGTAEPGFLKAGMYVRFEAKLDKQGNVKDEVTKLDIVDLSENVQLRLDPDIGPGDELKELEKKGPVNYLVIGKLKTFKKGELLVATPENDVKAKLADKPEITVDVADLSLVSEGDKIEIKGKLGRRFGVGAAAAAVNAVTPGFVLADEIKVTLAKPLEGKKSAGGKKGSKKSAGKKPVGKKPRKKGKKPSADDGFGNGGGDS
ncbi:MAG TPA: hypothetical protein VMV69_09185 [Pirellulales bacterium]|nr:hypothetical protein [Pirellulales bacterium]